MDEQVQKILFDELPKTHYGKALEIYLQEELDKLNDVSTLGTWDDALGRKNASQIIKKIFRFLNAEKTNVKKRTSFE